MHFATILELWYDRHGRQLPWRQTRNPYHIWISEIILQQTRVAQGHDYYQRFVKRFPTVEALASASTDDVMQQWEGLGYYSRARNLHAAARQIQERGHFPTDYDAIRALKGVGDYTAAAIASFAFGLPYAVVDGNVYRLLSRYFGIETPIDTTRGKKQFTALAATLLDARHPALYNQAIMDFGALQCVPKNPDCQRCPLADSCQAHGEGRVAMLPVKSRRTAVKERYLTYILLFDGEAIYIHRRPEGDIWAGLYEPLLIEDLTPSTLSLLQGKAVVAQLHRLRHQLTHRTLYADAYLVRCSEAEAQQSLPADFVRVPLTALDQYAAPRLVNNIYEAFFVQ